MHAAPQGDLQRAQTIGLGRRFGQNNARRVERAPLQTGRIKVEPVSDPDNRCRRGAGQKKSGKRHRSIAGDVMDRAGKPSTDPECDMALTGVARRSSKILGLLVRYASLMNRGSLVHVLILF